MLTLTKLEKDILDHRLEISDCICEALNDGATEDLERWHEDDVEDVCLELLRGDYEGAKAINERLFLEVLIDAVEGSTYYGAAIADQSKQKLAAIKRAGESLASKIDFIIERDKPIEFPLY